MCCGRIRVVCLLCALFVVGCDLVCLFISVLMITFVDVCYVCTSCCDVHVFYVAFV